MYQMPNRIRHLNVPRGLCLSQLKAANVKLSCKLWLIPRILFSLEISHVGYGPYLTFSNIFKNYSVLSKVKLANLSICSFASRDHGCSF